MKKLDRLGWVVYRSYGVGPYRFGLRTTSRRFGAWFDSALSRYRIEDQTETYMSVVVGDQEEGDSAARRDFHILYRRTNPVVRTLDLSVVRRSLLNEFEACTFPERDDAIYTNAALVSVDGQNALIPADLAAAVGAKGRRVERSGIKLPLNLSIAIDPGSGAVVPMRSALDVRQRTPAATGGNGDGSLRVVEEPTRVGTVFTMSRGSDLHVRPISRARGLHHLASVTPNLLCMPKAGLEGLKKLVSGTRCYELELGNVGNMLDSILLTVRGGV